MKNIREQYPSVFIYCLELKAIVIDFMTNSDIDVNKTSIHTRFKYSFSYRFLLRILDL